MLGILARKYTHKTTMAGVGSEVGGGGGSFKIDEAGAFKSPLLCILKQRAW